MTCSMAIIAFSSFPSALCLTKSSFNYKPLWILQEITLYFQSWDVVKQKHPLVHWSWCIMSKKEEERSSQDRVTRDEMHCLPNETFPVKMFYHASHSLSEAIKQKLCLSEPWKDSHQHSKTKKSCEQSQPIRTLPSQLCLHVSKQPDQGMQHSPCSPTCQLWKLQSSLYTTEKYRFRIKTACFLKTTIIAFKYRPKDPPFGTLVI